jgi:hypothetical protein
MVLSHTPVKLFLLSLLIMLKLLGLLPGEMQWMQRWKLCIGMAPGALFRLALV